MSNPIFMADLETTTDPEDCRMWAWAIVEVGHTDVEVGTTWDRFFEKIFEESCTIYFHNIKFDGDFILVQLYERGFDLVKETRKMPDYTFSTMISDKGQFYSITIQRGKTKVTMRDSLKVLPMPVAAIAKGFGMEMSKGSIDYDLPRPPGYRLTAQEIDYIKRDVLIVAKALETLHAEGLTATTQAGNALQDYKKLLDKGQFKRWYPTPPVWKHDELAQSYKGGFTWANPRYQGQVIGEGLVLDKNSMYPWVMSTKPMPVNEPIFFEGKYQHDNLYPLYIQRIRCQFEIKPDHIPTIQIKMAGPWAMAQYLTTSTVTKTKKDGSTEIVETEAVLTLTNIDLKLFLEHYNVYNLEYLDGYKFRQSYGIFTEYISKWYKRKEKATLEKNKPMRQISKLMLNALYGKFGTNPHAKNKWPYYDAGKIKYVNDPEETDKKPIYVPVAAFVTSYAREECIRCAQKVYDRFLYADTDSLHLIGLDPPDLDIDPVRLGAWKCEGIFRRGKYLRAKSYVEEIYDLSDEEIAQVLVDGIVPPETDYELKVTCAGMPKDCYPSVTFDNFQVGSEFPGKLKPVHVPGGTVLIPTPFSIKP